MTLGRTVRHENEDKTGVKYFFQGVEGIRWELKAQGSNSPKIDVRKLKPKAYLYLMFVIKFSVEFFFCYHKGVQSWYF